MLRLTAAAVALVAIASPAMSQTDAPAGARQVPSAQNSGAGIPGQPGNKNGPAARPPSATSGAGATTSDNPAAREQDSAKIPGQPGNKSGPAQAPQPGSTGR